MIEKIIVVALIVLAVASMARRLLFKGASSCGRGCGCSEGGSESCCGGKPDIEPRSDCGCSRKS